MKLASNHTCKHCGSHKIRCIENDFLWKPEKHEAEEDDYNFTIDNEVYMILLCDSCNSQYQHTFAIVEKLPRDEESQLKYYEEQIKKIKLKKFLAEPK